MSWTIENDKVKATINTKGGELASLILKETEVEYIWQADPEFWGRHAPVLFPIVGKLIDNTYTYEGKSYTMGQHGFARDKEFFLIEQTESLIKVGLKSDDSTREVYPFDFELILSFELEEENLICGYKVRNSGKNTMYFGIGAHPAFNIPLASQGDFNDYYFEVSGSDRWTVYPLEGAHINQDAARTEETPNKIDITRELFKGDALVFGATGKHEVSIKSDLTDASVKVSYGDMPFIGLWSPYAKEAPFVCIEPWCGIADTTTSTGDISEKFGMNRLGSQEVFTNSYTITVK